MATFQGNVRVTRGLQSIEAEELRFDPRTNRVEVSGRATYREPAFSVGAKDASYDSISGEARFYDAEFEMPARPARGEAERAMELLAKAVDLGASRYFIEAEPDFQAYRGLEEFQALLPEA